MAYGDSIDSITSLPQELTYELLRVLFQTGRSVLLKNNGYEKKYGYRNGVQTPIGDIEQSVWVEAIKTLIEKNGDNALYEKLFDWYKDVPCCGKTKQERELYVLDVFSNRIFDNPGWVDYIPFNEKHRPGFLAMHTDTEHKDLVVG